MAVYDASWQRPPPSKLKPGDGIILYVSRTASKCPTIAECDAYRARGVTVRFVFEDSADQAATAGYAAGKTDGAFTLAQVKAKGGQAGDAVYFACDTYATINIDYARGFGDGLTTFFEPRLYAGDRNLELVRTHLGMTLGWQASAASWSDHWHYPTTAEMWSLGTYPYASLYQSPGASPIPGTDLNIVNNPAWTGGNGDPVTQDEIDQIAAAAAYAVWHTKMQGSLTAPYQADVLLTDIRGIVATCRDSSASAAQHSADADNQTTGLGARLDAIEASLTALAAAVAAIPTGGTTTFNMAGTLTPQPAP